MALLQAAVPHQAESSFCTWAHHHGPHHNCQSGKCHLCLCSGIKMNTEAKESCWCLPGQRRKQMVLEQNSPSSPSRWGFQPAVKMQNCWLGDLHGTKQTGSLSNSVWILRKIKFYPRKLFVNRIPSYIHRVCHCKNSAFFSPHHLQTVNSNKSICAVTCTFSWMDIKNYFRNA